MKCRTEHSKGVTIMAILEVNNVKKIYTTRFGGNQVQALSNINFSVEKGEYVAIMGESGSGKTTLLNILAALDSRATDGLLKLFSQINAEGQTVVMVTHSTKAASHANRILFIKDGEVFHQIYRGNATNEQLYVKISDALTVLTTGGEEHE